MKPLVPDHIDAIAPYQPGKPIEEVKRELGIADPAKLASNENCLGPSPKAVEAAAKALSAVHLYPESSCFYLRQSLAKKMGVPGEQFVFGNGSHDLLDVAVRTFTFPDDEVLTADITFVAYRLAAQVAGRPLVQVPLKEMTYDLDAMADAITDKTKVILIANPNNPTGTMVRTAAFEAFVKRVPEDVVLVVDEAYFEYVDDPEYPNSLDYHTPGRRILTTRTFSKIYGLAGLRIGYGIAPPEMVTAMNKTRLVFSVNRVAQAAALAALDDTEHVERSADVARAGRQWIYEQLEQRKIRYWPSHTNFVFVEFAKPSRQVFEAMMREGVIIRPMPGNYARITVGRPDENRMLAAALDAVL